VKSLYLRIYLTVVLAVAAFALASGWLVQRHVEQERSRVENALQERFSAWAELLQRSLPPPDAPRDEQAQALREWALRLRLPMAIDDAQGQRIGASDAFLRREADAAGGPLRRALPLKLDDGRTLWLLRPNLPRMGERPPPGAAGKPPAPGLLGPPGMPPGLALAALLLLLFMAVVVGAYPVVRGLTRRLEALKQGVEAFGGGELQRRVPEEGRDEVAAVARSFNQAAARVQVLLDSHRHLLANASHELRSPLARMKMALSLLHDAAPAQRERLQAEVQANISELDALVDEVLLASRLEAGPPLQKESVDVLAVAAEEAARVQAEVTGQALHAPADERLLRRALRNLLENARRYGGSGIEVHVQAQGGQVQVAVEDRGPGVPQAQRERIFEAFFRLPGHAEHAGGVGLGLALVRQIAQAHGGSVRCEPREGGGSRFVFTLPLLDPAPARPAER
jgi:signal transduction histidine kinase